MTGTKESFHTTGTTLAIHHVRSPTDCWKHCSVLAHHSAWHVFNTAVARNSCQRFSRL